MVTIEEIQKAFKVAFNGDSTPLTYQPDIDAVIRTYGTREDDYHDVIAHNRFGLVFGDSPYTDQESVKSLILNLPALCKMLIDATAENERLKADSARVALRLKYPNVKLGLRVRYQGEIYKVVGGDYLGKAHLKSEYGEQVYCTWAECEVIEE